MKSKHQKILEYIKSLPIGSKISVYFIFFTIIITNRKINVNFLLKIYKILYVMITLMRNRMIFY